MVVGVDHGDVGGGGGMSRTWGFPLSLFGTLFGYLSFPGPPLLLLGSLEITYTDLMWIPKMLNTT